MIFPRVQSASPEQGFIAVRNAHSVTLTPGHAAFFHHDFASTTIFQTRIVTDNVAITTVTYDTVATLTAMDGYSVTYAGGDTNPAPSIGAFAGVVAGRPIPPAEIGSVQCWGPFDGVVIKPNTQAPFSTLSNGTASLVATTGTQTFTTFTFTFTYLSQLSQYLLRPLGLFNQATEGGATTHGYFGIVSVATTQTNAGAIDFRPSWFGPFLQMMGPIGGTSVPAAAFDTTVTVTCKAFIRAL